MKWPAAAPAYALLGLLPAAVLGLFLARYAVNVPYLDQWELVPLLSAERLEWSALWAQHNEHRILLPRLVMLALAHMSAWDVRAEIMASFLFAVLSYLLFVRIAAKEGRAWLALPIGIAVFSAVQWQNWFLGWQLQIFLALLLVLVALWCVVQTSWWGPIAAFAAAAGASLSFGGGMLVWPAGFVALLLAAPTRRALRLLVWSLSALGTTAAFAQGYERIAYHPAPASFVVATFGRLAYVCAYLGAPVLPWSVAGAGCIGATGLAVFALLVWRQRDVARSAAGVFWIVIAGFALSAALLTAWVRVGYGLDQALSSRYTTLAMPLWIALIALLARGTGPAAARWAALGLVAAGLAAGSLHGAYTWSLRYPAYEEARAKLYAGDRIEELSLLYPDAAVLAERRSELERLQYSVFAP